MTEAQVKWAMAHDWFGRLVVRGGGGVVGVMVRDEWNQAGRTTIYDFQELRRWAGY